MNVRHLHLPGGPRLPVVEHGDPAGTPVLLLHGVTDSWRSWEPVLPLLPRSLRAIAVTQRGHAGASQPAAGYAMPHLAADAAGVLDALGIAGAVVVGHSMGSVVAQHLAATHPQRVSGLVLLGSFSAMARIPGVRALAAEVARLTDPVDPAFVREFQAGTMARPGPPGFLDMVVGESLALPARVWHALFESFLAETSDADLAAIRAPTIVVWGERETLCPRDDQALLCERIRGAHLQVVPGAGHAVHWDVPEAPLVALRALGAC